MRANNRNALRARDRRQRAHRLAFDQPSGVAVERDVLDPQHRLCRLLRHQQIEGKRGKRPRRHDQEMPLVLDQRFDGTDERDIKLVRESEVEQHRLAGGLLQLVEIEAAAECGDLLREVLGTDRNRAPVEAIARQREDVALLVSGQEEDQRLIGAEQLLHFLGLERLRARERRILGELPFEPRRVGVELALGLGKLPPQCADRAGVLLALRC